MANDSQEQARKLARVEEWELPQDQLLVGKVFAEGAVGSVFKGRWRGLDVAVKKLRKEVTADKLAKADLINEILVLAHLRHPNVVMFLGAVTTGDAPVIVFEYMSGGSVEGMFREKLRKRGMPWRPPRAQSQRWAQDLAKAVCFLHNCSPMIIHRDIKPANLLLAGDMTLKLSDFGISKSIKRDVSLESYTMTGVTGSKRYMAPEVYQSKKYDESVDIFSFAMCVWYLYLGERPFSGRSGDEAATAAAKGERPSVRALPAAVAQLVSQCWDTEAGQRPNATQLVEALDVMVAEPGSKGCVLQ